MGLKAIKERENMYILDDGRVRSFLFVGEKDALLVDAGFSDSYVVAEAGKIAGLPIRLVLTHGDGDHTGGLKEIGECYVHAADKSLLDLNVTVREVDQGDHFHIGEYDLEVVHTPAPYQCAWGAL